MANVEPVVSTMGFAGLDEGNGDAGQHGQPGSPGMNNDVVPVLGSPVQGDAERRGQSTTLGTVADDGDGSGPKRCSFGPGGLLVDKSRSTRNADAGGADVSVSGSAWVVNGNGPGLPRARSSHQRSRSCTATLQKPSQQRSGQTEKLCIRSHW